MSYLVDSRYKVNAHIEGNGVSAQLRSYEWGGEQGTFLFEDYLRVSLCLTQHLVVKARPTGAGLPLTLGQISMTVPYSPVHFYLPDGRMEFLICMFAPEYVEDAAGPTSYWNDREMSCRVDVKSTVLKSLMKRIYGELVRPGFAARMAVEAAADLVLVEVARHFRRAPRSPGEPKRAVGGLSPWQLRRIQERINDSVDFGDISHKDLAQLCRLSQSHMMRCFKNSTGMSISQYTETRRFERAKKLLSTTTMSCKEIAYELGFSSPSYFTAAFRRITAMSPSEFRCYNS